MQVAKRNADERSVIETLFNMRRGPKRAFQNGWELQPFVYEGRNLSNFRRATETLDKLQNVTIQNFLARNRAEWNAVLKMTGGPPKPYVICVPTFSFPGFNNAGDQAIVSVDWPFSGIGGHGTLECLSLKSETWHHEDSVVLWFS